MLANSWIHRGAQRAPEPTSPTLARTSPPGQAQSTHLTRVSLERRDDMTLDVGMARGQDMVEPAETRDQACAGRIQARRHGA